jgi:hypothetical protein
MLHALLMLAAAAPAPAAKGVTCAERVFTRAEKETFFRLVRTLPTSGEFFTDEAVKKAAPHTGVLLALTEKDLEGYDMYTFLALSRGLCDLEGPRSYAVKHFGGIAHPEMKLSWAVMLFDEKAATPEVVRFLRAALKSKEQAEFLSQVCGPKFEAFKKQVQDYRRKEK